jgi:uncharacterized protein (UPF0332 family)
MTDIFELLLMPVTMLLNYMLKHYCCQKMEKLRKSHRGIVGMIGEYYVKPGELAGGTGRDFNKCLRYRKEARYEPHLTVEGGHAEAVIKLAEDFRSSLHTVLRGD